MKLKYLVVAICVIVIFAAFFIVLMLTGILPFGGGTKNNSKFVLTAFSWGDDYKDLAASVDGMLTDYYMGQIEGDFQRSMLCYPDFYVEREKQWIDANSDLNYDAFMKSNDDWCKAEYGEDYQITLEVGKLMELTEDSVREMEQILANSFDITMELRECYHFEATEHLKGSLKSEDNALEWYILYFDGKVYLYDSIYES